MRRLLILLAVLAVVGCVIFLIGYEVIFVDFVSFQEDQPSVDYQDGPRILAPEGAVPVSRPTYLDDPANLVNPVPPDEVSMYAVASGPHRIAVTPRSSMPVPSSAPLMSQ